jgi:hypothetical protein
MLHRLKRSFTAGELSPILLAQIENDRFRYGCRQLRNMVVRPQGPASRREGFEFMLDLTPLLGTSIPSSRPRIVPFIFSATQAYALIFYKHSSGKTRVVFGYGDGMLADPVDPTKPYVFEFTGVFDIDKFTYAQSADILFIAQPGRIPLELKRTDIAAWTATEAVFTDTPEWDGTKGYPGFVAFYEQRIAYASNTARPQTVWFSKSGDYYDFGRSSPLVSSDAMTITLDSDALQEVCWMNATKHLLIGTIGDEWAVSGSGYEPMSFSSIRAPRHTKVGSKRMTPLMVGSATLFVERHGKTVNQFVYDYNSDSYDVVDLSVLAEHLTDNNTILDWAYQQVPYGVVWCVRDDGKLIALTFKREHNVTGWHVHDTLGIFLAVGCIPGTLEDDVWTVVKRMLGTTEKWYVEKKQPTFRSDSPLDGYFLDSHVVYDEAEPALTFEGLDHLEGKTVSVLADGGVQSDQVVTNGEITLDVAASRVVVGLPYSSVLEPTLLELALPEGTVLGRVAKIVKLDVMLYKSIGFEYGTIDAEDGTETMDELSFRYPSNTTGEQVPLFTGSKEVSFPGGYSAETRVLVRQRKPLPLTVIAVVDNVEVYS